MEPHAARAMRNHGQTLERLAERGGLCPIEALAVYEERDCPTRATGDEIEALAGALGGGRASRGRGAVVGARFGVAAGRW